jgi:hypothetical protein
MQMNWKKLGQIVLMLGVILVGKSAFATTYYVDYSSGNDSNNGTTKSTPWQRAPGMIGCASACSAATINPGDSVILKGGVTWPNGTMPWQINVSGASGNNVYWGVDQTWYTGGGWTRPILNGGGTAVGGNNDFIVLYGSYMTVDNFEMTGLYCLASSPYGDSSYINATQSTYSIVQNTYMHGWVNQTSATDSCTGILSDSHSPSYDVGNVYQQNVIDGSDTAAVIADPSCTGACLGTLDAFWYGPIVRNNVVNQVSNGYVGGAQEFSGNLIENVRVSAGGNHENGFENNSDPCATGLLFFNNVIRHTTGVNIWIAPTGGACATTYAFNNITYNTTAGNVWDVAYSLNTPSTGGTYYAFNNTIECGPDGSASQVCTGCPSPSSGSCHFENNHLITSSANPIYVCGGNCTKTTNLAQTQSAANAAGYTASQTNAFSPRSGSSPTVGAGTNIDSSLCAAVAAILASAGTACQNATAYSVAYNSTNHTASIPGLTLNARPSSGAWDVGAYQFGGAGSSTSQTLQPPSGLIATVH